MRDDGTSLGREVHHGAGGATEDIERDAAHRVERCVLGFCERCYGRVRFGRLNIFHRQTTTGLRSFDVRPVTAARRAMLAGLSAAPALALPALAGAPQPDATFLALVSDFAAVDRDLDAANEAEGACSDAAAPLLPDEPDALRRKGDFRSFWGRATNPHSPVFYTASEVDAFRDFEPPPTLFCERDREAVRARAQEIVAAYDAWWTECGRIFDITGVTAADAACERLRERRLGLISAILAARPITLVGFQAKARVSAAIVGGSNDQPFFVALRDDLLALGGDA